MEAAGIEPASHGSPDYPQHLETQELVETLVNDAKIRVHGIVPVISPTDQELAEMIARWSVAPDVVKAGIIGMLRAITPPMGLADPEA